MNDSWISLHRKIIEWEWYGDSNTFRLFLHLLLMANHSDKKWKGIIIKRGQRVTSLKSLSKEINISKQSVRTSLNKLESTQEITIVPTHRNSIISVCNYNTYQSGKVPANTVPTQSSTQSSTQSDNTLSSCNDATYKSKKRSTNTVINTPINTKQQCNKEKNKQKDKSLKSKTKKSKYYATKLGEIIKTSKRIKITSQKINSWNDDFRKLHEIDGIERSRMKAALIWYGKNIGGQYIPVIESGTSFRNKFIKLENAMERAGDLKERNKPESDTKTKFRVGAK